MPVQAIDFVGLLIDDIRVNGSSVTKVMLDGVRLWEKITTIVTTTQWVTSGYWTEPTMDPGDGSLSGIPGVVVSTTSTPVYGGYWLEGTGPTFSYQVMIDCYWTNSYSYSHNGDGTTSHTSTWTDCNGNVQSTDSWTNNGALGQGGQSVNVPYAVTVSGNSTWIPTTTYIVLTFYSYWVDTSGNVTTEEEVITFNYPGSPP
jgi:hypothetical protein